MTICQHCGYKRNPYTGNCQNNHCPGLTVRVTVTQRDPEKVRAAEELRAELRRKSEETMAELLAECPPPPPKQKPEPVSRVVAHLKTITNEGLWGRLAR